MDSSNKVNSIPILLNQLYDLSKNISNDDAIDTKSRQALQKTVQQLGYALETPGDTVQRIAYLPLQTSAVRTAMDLGLYNKLIEGEDVGKSATELAAATGADPLLLVRIMRYLTAIGTMGQAKDGRYYPTAMSRTLVNPLLEAGVKHTFDTCGLPFMNLPSFLAETQYKMPTNPMHCPFQTAFNVDTHLFTWINAPQQSQNLDFFNTWMAGQREGRASWYDFFPIKEQLVNGFSNKKDAVMLIDVGGGRGHEIVTLKQKCPGIPGRMILQDLPETIEQVDKKQLDFEAEVHDFFTPQPVKGARAYYFRQIMHDWPDDKCQEILKQTVAAMERGYSKVLINDMVVPDIGAGLIPAQLDLLMMSMLAALERTESDWHRLIASVGLRIVKIWTLDEGTESVIEAVRD